MCMIDDAEPYEVWQQHDRRARKPHHCYECGREIASGERYEHSTGLYEGHWDTMKTCAHCLTARTWLDEECGGFVYGGVEIELREHWDEDPLLRSLWLGRAIIGMRDKWQRKGRLVPPLAPFGAAA